MPGIKSLRKIQMGFETTPGTAVPATSIWRGFGTPQDDREVVFVDEDIGLIGVSPALRSHVPMIAASLALEAVEATFEQLPYLGCWGIDGDKTGTIDDTGTDYIFTYAAPTTAPNTIEVSTIEGGDDQQAEEAAYAFAERIGITGVPKEALKMSADLVLREWAPDTFTPALAIPAVEDILFQKSKLYIDDSAGTIGTTEKSSTLLGMNLDWITGLVPVFTGDGDLFFNFHKLDGKKEAITLKITFEHDATAVAEIAKWRNQDIRLLRLEFLGSALETAGTEFQTLALRIDLAGKWERFSKIGEQDGNDIVEGDFVAGYSSVDSLKAELIVANEISTGLP